MIIPINDNMSPMVKRQIEEYNRTGTTTERTERLNQDKAGVKLIVSPGGGGFVPSPNQDSNNSNIATTNITTDLNNKINTAINSGQIAGFSGQVLTNTQMAKAQLLNAVNSNQNKVSTPLPNQYGEYYKATTNQGQNLLNQYKENQVNQLKPSEQLVVNLPKPYENVYNKGTGVYHPSKPYIESHPESYKSLESGQADAYLNIGTPVSLDKNIIDSYVKNVMTSSNQDAFNLALLGVGGLGAYDAVTGNLGLKTGLKLGTVVFSKPITELNQNVINSIIPVQNSGFAASGILQQLGRGSLFMATLPLTGDAYLAELAKGLATNPVGTGEGLYKYASQNPYEVGLISHDILTGAIEEGSRIRLNMPEGTRASLGDIENPLKIKLSDISPIKLADEPLIKFPKFKDVIQFGAKKGDYSVLDEEGRGKVQSYKFNNLKENPLGINEIVLKDTPSQLSNEEIQKALQEQEKVIAHVTANNPLKFNPLTGETSFKVKEVPGGSPLREFSKGAEKGFFNSVNEIGSETPQAYTYYAKPNNEGSFFDLLSGKAREGKATKPTIILQKEIVSSIPDELLKENSPITRAEKNNVLKELRKFDPKKASTITDSQLTDLTYHVRLARGLDSSGKVVPGVGALSGLRTELETIEPIGTKIVKYQEGIKDSIGKLFGYGKLKTNEGIFNVVYAKKVSGFKDEVENLNKEGKVSKLSTQDVLKSLKESSDLEDYYNKPTYDISKRLDEISQSIQSSIKNLSSNKSSNVSNFSVLSLSSISKSNNSVKPSSNQSNNSISNTISNMQSNISNNISSFNKSVSTTSKPSSNKSNSSSNKSTSINYPSYPNNPNNKPIILPFEEKKVKSKKSLGIGYYVFDKQIKTKNNFLRITPTPVTHARALDILNYFLDNSLVRTGLIKKANSNAVEDEFYYIPVGYYNARGKTLRNYQIKNRNNVNFDSERFIKKQHYLLDTAKERSDLQEFRKQASKILR